MSGEFIAQAPPFRTIFSLAIAREIRSAFMCQYRSCILGRLVIEGDNARLREDLYDFLFLLYFQSISVEYFKSSWRLF